MMEQAIMEVIKWFTGIFLVLGIVAVGIFSFQLQDVNSFKQQVAYQIERKGGLTTEALEELAEYSETYFNGRYIVNSEKSNQKVSFGEVVEYTIAGTYSIAFFPIPDIELNFHGMGVSQIR